MLIALGGIVGVILLFGLITLTTVLLIRFMWRIFFRASGYSALAGRFTADHEPQGETFTWQHLRIGVVRYRFCTTMVFSPEGLYLTVGRNIPLLRNMAIAQHPALLIPWSEVKAVNPTILYLQSAIALTIGEPQIAVIAMMSRFAPLVKHYTSLTVR
jgi:hypothetical protein